MMIKIHQDVRELLNELNEIDESIIFGGYLRDMIFDNIPNDVDIATKVPIDILVEKYGHLEKAKKRKTTSGQDVFSFKMHRTEKIFVEIVCTQDDLYDKARKADYTLNSLLYDGKNLIDLQGGLDDISNKLIREVDARIITKDLETRPYLWLKTLRLISVTGFDLSDETFSVLNENKKCIYNISNEIMQTEGHKTLNGLNPFKAIELLHKMGFVASFDVKHFKEIKYSLQPQQQLCLLAVLSNKEIIDDFINFYHLQQDLKEKYDKLYSMYHGEDKVPSRFRHQIITIKKIVKEMESN
ncbi:tRNA nucleotidyltransferase [Bacillus phage G]|uniref:Gp199 n=1 Tax=Bacillus phage G TaxID=2884420 RepID=G3MBR5_9CAUD|nr:tRNA nucleotidyltransferase [Bacillus phage G]AEO93458.1 gp199 [Bacillus phage G]